MYINISRILKNNTANHLQFGQQCLGLTLRLYISLWNLAVVLTVHRLCMQS